MSYQATERHEELYMQIAMLKKIPSILLSGQGKTKKTVKTSKVWS